MTRPIPKNFSIDTAVVLCGGLSTRMGDLTKQTPKALLIVNEKPIIWYTIKFLMQYGVKKLIFPLGYLGNKLQDYISKEFRYSGLDLIFEDTGRNTPIHIRISKVQKHLKEFETFLLLNSDTIFSFNLTKMIQFHKSRRASLTLATVPIISPWGVIIETSGLVQEFQRDLKIDNVGVIGKDQGVGQIYSGLSIIESHELSDINLSMCNDFETDLFNKIIKDGKAHTIKINGFWYPIDTPKQLTTLNKKIEIALKKSEEHSLKAIGSGKFYE